MSVDRTGALVAGIVTGDVQVWDAKDGVLVQEIDSGTRLGPCQYCGIYSMSLNPTGELLAASGGAPKVLIFDVASGIVVKELQTAGENTGLVAFSADGQRLAVGSATKVEVFDLSGGVTVLPLDDQEGAWFGALSPDGTQVVLELPDVPDLKLAIVEVATGATLATFTNALRGNSAWSPDGSFLIADSRLLSATNFEEIHDFATGQLHDLKLVSTPEYVDSRTYTVSGTLSIDSGPPIEFSGVVDGHGSQRYIRPQVVLPRPATLDIELHGHQWRFEARQPYSLDYGTPVEPDGWWGSAIDRTAGPEGQSWYPLRLWRVP